MDTNTKRNVQLAFKKLETAYNNLNLAEAKAYYLVLGGVNEVHLVKRDGKKSIFLGRLFSNISANLDDEVLTIWTVIKKYFNSLSYAEEAVESKETEVKEEEAKPVKKSRKKKVTEEASVAPVTKEVTSEVVTEVVTDVESDVSVPEEEEEAFDDWTEKMNIKK